ncbi:squalene epoxidase [Coprinopsis marcescibilis]|uniref:Squalene monooxygenase n=1 Tax=Coprinopsis marcescibilis TaxID=230819 RepID=A0A5C3KP30_COPMA|nr:squalene epoxidase [Coprinopsis marcescibilis]
MSTQDNQYDVVIVGAGIAGSALAQGLSTLTHRSPLRIALLERSLEEPDRIVGELLQPGGVIALKRLGLESTLEGIDAIPVKGYCVIKEGQSVHIPYPSGYEGRSFHHGRFIQSLRAAATGAKGVDVIEATVTDLIQAEGNPRRIVGVTASQKVGGSERTEKVQYRASLVIVADGCFSNFRNTVMGESGFKPVTKSHFVGTILEDVVLPIPQHGNVALVKNSGPVLLYQIGKRDTRILVDVKNPLPDDLKGHILKNVVPQLPSSLHSAIEKAFSKDRLRRMPNSFLPSIEQNGPSCKDGVILLGDAWNMRHPLTGGGMTVALSDVVSLRDVLGSIPDFSNVDRVNKALNTWHWSRKPLASTVNILSFALYDLFGADDENLAVLRTGCFKYFERGGECVNGPVSLLSGIAPSPVLLFNHFFAVAFYSIWIMFTHPYPIASSSETKGNAKQLYATPRLYQYPALTIKAIRVFWTACIVFGPQLWAEIRWWSPSDTKRKNKIFLLAVIPFLLLSLFVPAVYFQAQALL